MSYVTVKFAPGVMGSDDSTPIDAEGHFVDADKMRFWNARAQKVRGYESLGTSVVVGVPRKMHVWAILSDQLEIAIGTHSRMYIVEGGQPNNITPIGSSGTLGADPFATTSGSATVTVTDTAHGLLVGDTVIYASATTVNGLNMNTSFTVVTVVDADSYTLTHTSNASGTGSGGGAGVTYQYEISVGLSSQLFGYGWGAGTWGSSTWGTARSSSDVILAMRHWSIDNWGEDLLFSHNDQGSLYLWDASTGITTRATVVSAAPASEFTVIDPESRHVIALGADGDPLNIQWCNQDDYTDWTPGAASTADERRLLHGSRFKSYIRTRSEILVWTDVALYGLQYVGATDYAFGLRRIADSISVAGPNAVCEFKGKVYWMSMGGFMVYDGAVRDIPCSINNTVFDDFDRAQAGKVVAAVLQEWQEIWFYYPSASGDGEIDKYAIYNTTDGTWTPGTATAGFQVLAWADRGLFTDPISVDDDGQTYYHDITFNADGAALSCYIESADFDLGDGDDMMLIKGYIPDFIQTGDITVTLKARDYPNATQRTKTPDTITTSTKFKRTKIRGRQASVRFASNAVDGELRIGAPRFDVQPDGKR